MGDIVQEVTVGCSMLQLIGLDSALQVVDAHLDGGMTSVTAAVKRCLQFYVDANAITAKTETSLRALIASLEGSDQKGC